MCVFYFGGVFEVLIKSVKKVIKVIFGDVDVIDEEFYIVICGVEWLLNFRLIIYVSLDFNDFLLFILCYFFVGEIGGLFVLEVFDYE